jgi:hypothetical protein
MEETNPYSPPATIDTEPLPEEAPEYTPLRTRARLAAIAIALSCAMSFVVDVTLLRASGADLEADTALALGLVGGGLATIVVALFAAVAYCVWLYAAAKNTRSLGEGFLQASPGWCVGSFFVPFANLYLPYRAVREIFEASDPARFGAGASPKRPGEWILRLWWGAWIVANILGNVSMRLDDFSMVGIVGLVGSVLLAIAGVTAVRIVNAIGDGQEKIFSERLRMGIRSVSSATTGSIPLRFPGM